MCKEEPWADLRHPAWPGPSRASSLSCSLNSPGLTFHFLVRSIPSGPGPGKRQGCELPPSVPKKDGGRRAWSLHGDLGTRVIVSLARPLFLMIPEQCLLLPRLPDPLAAADQRDTQVLCPLTCFKFSPRLGLSLSLWVPCTAWAPTWRRTSVRQQICSVGLAARGWGRREVITMGRLAFSAVPPTGLALGCFPPRCLINPHGHPTSGYCFDPGSKGA